MSADNLADKDLRSERRWTRIPTLDVASVYLPGGKLLGCFLVDESFSGVRLMFRGSGTLRAQSLNVGDTVGVVYHRSPMRGIVRNISTDEAGRLFVGVEWESK